MQACTIFAVLLIGSLVSIGDAGLLPISILSVQSAPPPPPSIVIIGGGMAGMSAADKLINTYKFTNVTVLEASDRVGGRVHPTSYPADGSSEETFYSQMCANWPNHKYTPLSNLVSSLGLAQTVASVGSALQAVHFFDQNGCAAPQQLESDFNTFLGGALQSVLNPITTLTSNLLGGLLGNLFQNFLSNKNYSPDNKKIMSAMYESSACAIQQQSGSGNVNTPPAPTTSSPQNAGTTPSSTVDLGKISILDEMTKRVPSDNIQLNSQVQTIRWNNTATCHRVQITLKDGRIIEADHVIVTVPLGHLKQFAPQLFDPVLPQAKSDAINGVGFGTVDKTVMAFDRPYWPTDVPNVNFIRPSGVAASCISSTQPLVETDVTRMLQSATTRQSGSSSLFTFWIGGQNSGLLASTGDSAIVDSAVSVMKKFLNNASIPSNPSLVRSGWSSDPLFGGSYSYDNGNTNSRSVIYDPLTVTIKGRKTPVVMFAGEATHENQYSTVSGAVATGVREADRLNTFYNSLLG